MNEVTRKNLEDTMNDCLDKAYACPADSEDYTKLIQKAVQIGEVLNEEKKIDTEKEVELKKIEQSGEISKKDLFVVGAPIVAGGIGLGFRSFILWAQTKAVCQFERDNTFTSSAGRYIAGAFRDLFSFNKRGR